MALLSCCRHLPRASPSHRGAWIPPGIFDSLLHRDFLRVPAGASVAGASLAILIHAAGSRAEADGSAHESGEESKQEVAQSCRRRSLTQGYWVRQSLLRWALHMHGAPGCDRSGALRQPPAAGNTWFDEVCSRKLTDSCPRMTPFHPSSYLHYLPGRRFGTIKEISVVWVELALALQREPSAWRPSGRPTALFV